ncbi:Gfo/Idh/MocA family oxidoreductase [Mesonia aestuariivivens]|uniref:Gfo/Idh/MocA family oxidoreductase n=1 Tax=Mesonia aestuariivivens TaxID=2796128 RepID=A0ABS6W0J8_9FLAO|nr:Gfo/Idh/MocA family oxidoreductase [Mesonia aestuariivivens]MBW2960644.1 Gfo/Idh/MocA family oxidoreductase [Mesonia aestuariivivens]
MKTNYNWGIIGLGKIAKKFATDLQSVEGANLKAVASRSLQKAEEFAEDFYAENFYGSYDELINSPEIEVIYIATPHVFHKELTIKCLKAKKAVLCEKAFGINKAEVEEMIATAKAENVFLMEALWMHFLPHYNYLLDLLEQNKYGKVKSLTADFGFKAPFNLDKRLFNKKLGGGSLLDIGIYPVFAAMTILGIPDTIEAEAKMSKTEIDEECSIVFHYKNGIKAKLKSSLLQETPTECHIKLENAHIKLTNRFHEPPSSLEITPDGEENKRIKFPVTTLGYNYEAIHVQKMLSQNKIESDVMTFEKSLQLISLLDEIRKKIGLIY